MTLPRVILSCEENFAEFAKPVLHAWKKLYPEIQVDIGIVTRDQALVDRIRGYGFDGVIWFLPIEGYPIENLAKLARHYHASIIHTIYGDCPVMLEDIDTAPLQTEFLNRIFENIEKGKILAVGREVYKDMCPGKFPISNLSGYSLDFQNLLMPEHMTWTDWIKYLSSLKPIDGKENPKNNPHKYSDESTIRQLIGDRSFGSNMKHIERGVDIHKDWIDRSWWNINEEKLKSNDYVLVNFLRPCWHNFEKMKPVFDFILNTDTVVEDLV